MAIVRTGYANFASFPPTGAIDIIYVDLSNGNEFTWVTSAYVAYTPVQSYVSLGYKDAVWFAANPGLLLAKGQTVHLEQTGLYKIGTGVTELQNLSFLGNMTTIQDGLTSGGEISVVGDDITVAPAGWLISPNVYGTLVNTDFLNITLSSAGNQRYIGFYGNTSNAIVKVEGAEAAIASYPTQPANTIIVGFVLVGDAVIDTQPDLTGFEEKINKVNTVVGNETDADKYASIPALIAYLQANYAFSLPAFFNAVRNTVLSGFDSAITWARVTTSTTIQNAISLLQRQSNYLQSTRFISGAGVSINSGDNTKFDIQVEGEIVDPNTFVPTAISVNLTAQTVTHIAAQPESYVWINSSGNLVQSLAPPIPTDFDVIIGYWVLVHSDLATLNVINSFPYYSDGTAIKVAQILNFIGFKKYSGTNLASAGTTGTRLSHTGGFAIKLGLGNTTKRPVALLTGAVDPSNMEMRHRLGVQTTGVQNIDVTNYNPSGNTVSALSNNKFTAHKIWKFSSSLIRVQFGQTQYDNYNAAIAGLDIDTFVDEGNASRNGLHIGWLVFKKGTSWGTGGTGVEGVDYKFVDVRDGRSSGGFTPTLQAGYDVSTQPQITTNSSKGAVQVKQGSGADTDKIIEGLNGSGVTTFSVNGNGTVNSASETANRIASFDASKNIKSLDTATYPSLTELSYVKGVTSAIQTQLDAKKDTFTLTTVTNVFNPADAVTYYFWQAIAPNTTATNHQFQVGFPCMVVGAIITTVPTGGTVGSSENSTVQLRNITTATSSVINSAVKIDGAATMTKSFTSTGLSISIGATDDVCLQFDAATFATNPSGVSLRVTLFLEKV